MVKYLHLDPNFPRVGLQVLQNHLVKIIINLAHLALKTKGLVEVSVKWLLKMTLEEHRFLDRQR